MISVSTTTNYNYRSSWFGLVVITLLVTSSYVVNYSNGFTTTTSFLQHSPTRSISNQGTSRRNSLFSRVDDNNSDGVNTIQTATTGNTPPTANGGYTPSLVVEDLFGQLNEWYTLASSIRCPFFRRRASDMIDGIAMMGRFLIIRHKTLIDPTTLLDDEDHTFLLPPGCLPLPNTKYRTTSTHKIHTTTTTTTENFKLRHLPLEEIKEYIRMDWEGNERSTTTTKTQKRRSWKGYYITGKLTTFLYRNDCFFEGPDPDMPVRGLRKYLSAASQLFEHKSSYAELIDLQILDEEDTTTTTATAQPPIIQAKWKIGGKLMLPWRPKVKDWTGSTQYYIDKEGLIYKHKETWDISVLEAFMCTVFPQVGNRIWNEKTQQEIVS